MYRLRVREISLVADRFVFDVYIGADANALQHVERPAWADAQGPEGGYIFVYLNMHICIHMNMYIYRYVFLYT